MGEFAFPATTMAGHIGTLTYRGMHEHAVKESGVVRFVPYSFRHTALTRWATAGMDPFSLQYLAGHKSIATTMRYIHLASKDAQDRLREVLAGWFRVVTNLGTVPNRAREAIFSAEGIWALTAGACLGCATLPELNYE